MLYDKLKNNDKIPFHMPGHKRNTKLLGNKFPYDIDITEIEGFDNLHKPEGIIKEIEDLSKELYETDYSFPLVNGSTVGILAGVASVIKRGDTVLIARNCHKSVYNALELFDAEVEFITPDLDKYGICKAVDVNEVEDKIKEYNPKLIIITSPTYEGVCSDIRVISEIAHRYNIPVMADSAHGAHNVADAKYADITIMSLHKTLPALTQCALAHLNGNLVCPKKFREKLSVFETSSPSYVLLASIEECLIFLWKKDMLFREFAEKRSEFIKKCGELKHLKVVEYDDFCKIIIYTGKSSVSGEELSDKLRKNYNIETEMSCENYVVLITTVCDDFNNYNKLYEALKEIDDGLESVDYSPRYQIKLPKKACNFFEVEEREYIDFKKSDNKICAEYIWAYPPGIPIIVPGEIITEELIEYITRLIHMNINIQSTSGKLPDKISVKA